MIVVRYRGNKSDHADMSHSWEHAVLDPTVSDVRVHL